MKISDLLNALINVSEKGANIARIIRSEHSLLELLVQEKKGDQKNSRFVQDFKTLADVLVQEVVRYDLKQKFPGFGSSIYGEESNKFTNTLGDSITVEIKDTPEQTQALLSQVLDDNLSAAGILSEVIHRKVHVPPADHSEELVVDIPGEDLGVWIDPIDSTAQYIQGECGTEIDGLVNEGLQCATVLIGVYEKSSGLPVIGVINQPFCTHTTSDSWSGRVVWGVCMGDIKLNSYNVQQETPAISVKPSSAHPVVLISSSESQSVQNLLSAAYTLRHVSGAGYKLLAVCDSKAEHYVLTRNTTFKWDSCAPHAILRSLGGGIVKYEDLRNDIRDVEHVAQITYHEPDDLASGALHWCNMGGKISYRSTESLKILAKVLRDNATV